MITRVELSDTDFNLLENLDREVMDLRWDYSRIGGSGSFSFGLPREFCNEKSIGGQFNIKIKRRNPITKAYDLWFQGLVEAKVPDTKASDEFIQIRGHGYQTQLANIYLDNVSFSSTEVSAIITSLLDNHVVPNTDISYSALDIETTGFTPSTITFNTDVLSAIQTLADIVGTREWGVDRNRSFFFKARSSSVGFIYPLGSKVLNFTSDDSFRDVVNRLIVQGGDVGGVPFTATFNDTTSQLKYNRRDKVYQNSAITTSDVAGQVANALFAEFSDVVRRGSCEVLDERLIEATTPLGTFQVVAPGVFYGERKYGTFLYAGRIAYQINRVNYSVGGEGNLRIRLDIGQQRPSVSESIKQIEYEVEQLRSAAL